MAKKKWGIGLDFDGVIHSYTSGWTDAYTIDDKPMPGAFAFLRGLLDDGSYDLYIYTARMGMDVENKPKARKAILSWFKKFGMEGKYRKQLKFAEGKPPCILFIDDRGWQFTGTFPSIPEVKTFKPWKLGRGFPIVTEVEWWRLKRCKPVIPKGHTSVPVLYARENGLTGRGTYSEGEFWCDGSSKPRRGVTHWAYTTAIQHPDLERRR